MNQLLTQTLKNLFLLCFLRSSPAQLPLSWMVLVVLIGIQFILDVYGLSLLKNTSFLQAFGATSLYFSLFIALVYFALAYRKFSVRLPKTLMAIFGTELILSMFLKLFLFIPAQEILILQSIFFVWNISVKSKIFKDALEIKMPLAVVLTFGIYLIASLPLIIVLGSQLQAVT